MSMQAADDGVLIRKVRQGNLDAYGELVRRYQGSVFGVCYRMLGERREAEDLVQDAFIRGFERLGTFDLAYPFGPWIRAWRPTCASTACSAANPRSSNSMTKQACRAGIRGRRRILGFSPFFFFSPPFPLPLAPLPPPQNFFYPSLPFSSLFPFFLISP